MSRAFLSRLQAIQTLPTGGAWLHNGRLCNRPITPNDDVCIIKNRDCWLVHRGTATVKVDRQDGAVYFTDRGKWTNRDVAEFERACLRHFPK